MADPGSLPAGSGSGPPKGTGRAERVSRSFRDPSGRSGFRFRPICGILFQARIRRRFNAPGIHLSQRALLLHARPSGRRPAVHRPGALAAPDAHTAIPAAGGRRIVPLFFSQAPDAWRDARPRPQADYVHFHSAYDDRGAVRHGYWLRHTAKARFTYDMGGRVTQDSPLYHLVEPGPDRRFARILEFDHGPGN